MSSRKNAHHRTVRFFGENNDGRRTGSSRTRTISMHSRAGSSRWRGWVVGAKNTPTWTCLVAAQNRRQTQDYTYVFPPLKTAHIATSTSRCYAVHIPRPQKGTRARDKRQASVRPSLTAKTTRTAFASIFILVYICMYIYLVLSTVVFFLIPQNPSSQWREKNFQSSRPP